MKHTALETAMIIDVDRFDMRPLRTSDSGLIAHYAGDPRVARMTTSIPHPLPPGASEALVTRAMAEDRDEDIWALDGTKSGQSEVMGLISLKRMDRNQSEISYWVAPPFWNKGIARAAVAAIVSQNPLGNATIFACVFHDNPASAKVLTECGFAYLGDAEYFSVARDATVPTWTYLKKLD